MTKSYGLAHPVSRLSTAMKHTRHERLTTQTCVTLSSFPLYQEISANAYLSHDLQLEMVFLPRGINPLNFYSAVSEGAEHRTSEVCPVIRYHSKWLAYTQLFIFCVRVPSSVSVNGFQYALLLVKKTNTWICEPTFCLSFLSLTPVILCL